MFRSSRRAVLSAVLLSGACVGTQHVTPGMECSRELSSRSVHVAAPRDSVAYGQDAQADPGTVFAMTYLVCMIPIWIAFAIGVGKLLKHPH
jgi:hypothetical protein